MPTSTRPAPRLAVERLEGRTTPATFVVCTPADAGADEVVSPATLPGGVLVG